MTDLLKRLDEAAAKELCRYDAGAAYDANQLDDDGRAWRKSYDDNNWSAFELRAQAARKAILAEIEAIGWQVVPKDATAEMLINATDEGDETPYATWRLMLFAAPKLIKD